MPQDRRHLDALSVTLGLLCSSHSQRANGNARALPTLSPTLERELRLPRLQRLISKRTSALELALAENAELWRELRALWELRRERREWAYFEMGFEEGVRAQALLEALRSKRDGA